MIKENELDTEILKNFSPIIKTEKIKKNISLIEETDSQNPNLSYEGIKRKIENSHNLLHQNLIDNLAFRTHPISDEISSQLKKNSNSQKKEKTHFKLILKKKKINRHKSLINEESK